jgi:hypothetical protein
MIANPKGQARNLNFTKQSRAVLPLPRFSAPRPSFAPMRQIAQSKMQKARVRRLTGDFIACEIHDTTRLPSQKFASEVENDISVWSNLSAAPSFVFVGGTQGRSQALP